MLDFEEAQIREYTKHWCTAVRLARNEPEEEARKEGAADGKGIVDGFEGHPFIRNLARNPLMLSAICLVNYFEGGKLPKDRGVLYRLCVEGLLHNWDQRRGIHSEFAFDEKLRNVREVALAMQAADRAEQGADKVREIFAGVLDDSARADKLLEHHDGRWQEVIALYCVLSKLGVLEPLPRTPGRGRNWRYLHESSPNVLRRSTSGPPIIAR